MIYTEKDIGTHSYKLYEVNTALENVTYSDKIYDVSVTVALDDNGELKATVAIDGEITDDPVAHFENIYDADVEIPPTGDMSLPIIVVSLITSITVIVVFTKKRRKVI